MDLLESDVVKLTMAYDVPKEVQDKIEDLKTEIINVEIEIETTYYDKEFNPSTGEFVEQYFKESLKK